MVLYRNDLELVGSDANFDMVLPDLNPKRTVDFVTCFLSIPLFCSCQPDIYYYNTINGRSEKLPMTREELKAQVREETRPLIYIDVNCQIMDALPDHVQSTLYQISETRSPHESLYGNVESPCMAPVEYKSGRRGNMTVTLKIMPHGMKQRWYTDKSAILKGYVHHEELLMSDHYDYPCFSLSSGPGFYYEYAIFIMEYLREHFPGLGTAGGVGRDGKWTDGFTYANSIYNYEKIQLPVRFNVEHTLKRLRDCDIIRSYRSYFKEGWNYDRIEQFRMVNLPEEYPRKERIMFFSEYADYVEWVLHQNWDTYKTICATAAHVILPKPERYGRCLETMSRLRKNLLDVGEDHNDIHYCGHLSFAYIDGQLVGEFRVLWYMKNYLLNLLDLKDSGRIDQIKAQMYQRLIYE